MERVKGGELFEVGSNRLQVDTTGLWDAMGRNASTFGQHHKNEQNGFLWYVDAVLQHVFRALLVYPEMWPR